VIRQVLLKAYPSGSNVDDELVNLLLRPALEPGASEAFRGFINLFKDRLAPDLLQTIRTPVAMLWGESDPWEPVDGAIQWQQFETVQSLDVLPGLGHCPHDEDPALLNSFMLKRLLQGDS
jgi:pimeloyl-ACP methyl ester carboxylesterase